MGCWNNFVTSNIYCDKCKDALLPVFIGNAQKSILQDSFFSGSFKEDYPIVLDVLFRRKIESVICCPFEMVMICPGDVSLDEMRRDELVYDPLNNIFIFKFKPNKASCVSDEKSSE